MIGAREVWDQQKKFQKAIHVNHTTQKGAVQRNKGGFEHRRKPEV